MKNFVYEFWFWLSVISGLTFLYGYGTRWVQTMGYSLGHRVLGLIGVSGVAVCVMVLAFARSFAWVFLPLGLIGLSAWLLYNNWFFGRYPIPVDGIRENTPPAGQPDFAVHSRILDYLSQEEADDKPGFFAKHFRTLALIAGLVFAFGFGFTRVVYYIREGDRRVAESIRTSAKQSDQVVRKAVTQLSRQTQTVVKQAVDSLQLGQAVLAQGIDSNARQTKALTGVIRQTNERAGALSRKVGNVEASVERARRSPLLIVSPIPAPGSNPPTLSPDRVQPLPQGHDKLRKRKVSQLVADSTINLVRNDYSTDIP